MMDATDLLWKDYELKVRYLTDHFSRMWIRFNFFLTIHSALLAVSLDKDTAKHAPFLAAAGLILAVLWYGLAATDNFLVEVYRRQVAHVFHLLEVPRAAAFTAAGLSRAPKGYTHAGCVQEAVFDPETGLIKKIPLKWGQWRFPGVSVTELGVVFAGLYGLLWIVRFVLWYVEPSTAAQGWCAYVSRLLTSPGPPGIFR